MCVFSAKAAYAKERLSNVYLVGVWHGFAANSLPKIASKFKLERLTRHEWFSIERHVEYVLVKVKLKYKFIFRQNIKNNIYCGILLHENEESTLILFY